MPWSACTHFLQRVSIWTVVQGTFQECPGARGDFFTVSDFDREERMETPIVKVESVTLHYTHAVSIHNWYLAALTLW